VSFYLHDQLQLACWERPGELPTKRPGIAPTGSKPSAAKPAKIDAGKASATADGVAAASAAVLVAANVGVRNERCNFRRGTNNATEVYLPRLNKSEQDHHWYRSGDYASSISKILWASSVSIMNNMLTIPLLQRHLPKQLTFRPLVY
jgi:hypothetical protein